MSKSIERRLKLSREFYTRDSTLRVARELLDKRLVVPAADGTRVSGRIVETEAYMGPEDRAAHSFAGRRTARTEAMYAVGGTAYIFFVYGMYYQLNVVTNRISIPHAILLRAVEPEEGIELMRERRPVRKDTELTNGPGKLCIAFGIDKSYNGADLIGDRIWIEDTGSQLSPRKISAGPRVGIDYAAEFVHKPWRFWITDNLFVSRPPGGNPRPKTGI